MIVILAGLVAASCPDGLEYFYNQKFVLYLTANNFTYFYTNTPKHSKLSLQMKIMTEKPVKFAAERSYICPNKTTPVFATLPGDDKWHVVETYFKDPTMSMIAIGVWSDEEQILQGQLLHQELKKYSKPIVTKLIIIFIGMCVITLTYFYLYELPRSRMEKEKME